jgi:uncharacterized membrane protein
MSAMTSIQSFSIGETFSKGWQVFKEKWAYVYLVGIVTLIASTVPSMVISGLIPESQSGLMLLFQFLNFVWSSIVAMGNIYILIRVVRGEPTEIADLIKPAKHVGQYIWATIRYSIMVMLGLLLFIFPGLYWGMKYMYVPYLIADKGMKSGDAFKLSGQMTQGVKLKLVLFSIVTVLFNLVGLLAVGLGLLITIPVTCLAQVAVYQTLLAQVPDSDAVEGETVA